MDRINRCCFETATKSACSFRERRASAHTSFDEVRILIERWRREYNDVRPHSSLGYVSPAEFAKFFLNNKDFPCACS